ncbi:MAG: zinc-binding dehydrogenase, partial [Chloroflexota bacterium]
MRAARLAGPKRFELVQAEVPQLQDGHVLIRLQRVSICGSDLRTYDRVLPEEQYPLPVGRPCHECAGVVVESRDDAYRPGQRVIVLPPTHNGLMEYIAEPSTRLIPLPDHGDLSTLLMCQPVGTVMYSCQRIGSVLGKRVVILGQGAIGLAFTQWMAQQGARQVIVTDLLDYRLEAARRVGATHTINPTREQVTAAVAEITHGELADVVVETVGRPETSNMIWEVVCKQGLVALFGLTHDQDVFPFNYD